MNIPESLHEQDTRTLSYPGELLARSREAKGLSREYVAAKLHLRLQVIERIETDQYDEMPQPVFVQGYLRAYAKLLGIAPGPILERYGLLREPEKKNERVLRQKQKEPLYREIKSRWMMVLSGIIIVILGYCWWMYHGKYLPQPVAEAKLQLSQNDTTEVNSQLSSLALIDSLGMEPKVGAKQVFSPAEQYDD